MAVDRFRLTNSAQFWNNINYWSATEGGGGGASVPVTGDTATFPVVGVNSTITFPALANYNAPNTFTARDSGSFYWNLNSVNPASGSQGILTFNGPTTVNVQRPAPTSRGQIGFSFGTVELRGDGPLIKTGPGLLNIGGDAGQGNNDYTGGTVVNEGWLRLTFQVQRLFGTGPITFANIGAGTTGIVSGASGTRYVVRNKLVANSSFNINFSDNPYGMTFNGADGAGVALEIDNLSNVTTITTSGAGADPSTIISGALAGAANNTFEKSGAATLTLSGTGTFAGVVRNAQGILDLSSNANALQNAVFEPGAGGTTNFAASSAIGGLTGSGAFALSATAMTIGGATVPATATYSGALSGNVTLTKRLAGTQTLAGTSTRTSAATNITGGAIQLNAATALYASNATGTTTVSSGAGLWLSGGITTPTNALITINGSGTALNGAIRNVSGSNTIGSSITLASTSTIQNDVSGTTLALKGLFTGTSSQLTLAVGSGATIRLDGIVSGSSTSSVLIPSTNAGTVQANITSLFFNMSVGTTVQIDSAFDLNGINQTFTGILDGIGSMSGAGTVTMRSGATLKAGSGAGGGTLSMGALVFDTGSETMSLVKNGGALSKVAVSGAVTHTGTVTVTANSTAGWTSGSTHTFLTYGSRSGAATFAAGALSGGTARQVMSIDTPGATAATFTVVDANASVTWAGGDSGNWYNTQATGWSGSGGITDFRNGDTVTFGSNTTTATLTGNVNVFSLTMNTANHTIGGAFTLTNAGALAVSGASFRQIINAAGEHAAVSVGTNAALEFGNANALGSGTTAITLTGTNAKLAFNSGANGLSTNRALTFTPGGAVSQYLETSGDAIVTIAGTVTNGTGATASIVKVGSGLVALTGTNSALAIFRIGDVSVAETAGRNVLRLVNPPGATAAAMRLNGASVLELTSNFSKVYGTSAGQIYLESGAGAGFSAYNASGISVSTSVNFGTTAGTQWNGPMYFGTALGTATGKLTMSGTLAVAASLAVPQTFHVFNGATAGAASSARINTLNSTLVAGFPFIKTGPGALFVVNGTYGAARASMRVSEGVYEVGPTTLNATGNIEIPSGATNAVVRQESSVAATTCPDFSPAPAANFTIEAAGSTGDFTLGILNIGNRTVTLSGSGTGAKPSDSGNGTGKYVKTGTGTWSLNYAYPSRAAGFSGGVDATQGTIKTNKKFGFGNGPVAITAGASVQFTDTATDPTIIGSITSLTTTGSSARLIIGA